MVIMVSFFAGVAIIALFYAVHEHLKEDYRKESEVLLDSIQLRIAINDDIERLKNIEQDLIEYVNIDRNAAMDKAYFLIGRVSEKIRCLENK